METPNISHLTVKDYNLIYEPAEDSFLLLDALESDLELLHSLRPTICLEIGTGSGVIITALACSLKTTTRCLGIDINPKACKVTKQTGQRNNVDVETVNMDLATSIKDGTVDLLVFNPPYVPTESEEVHESGIARSWAGGLDGREVVDRLFAHVPRVLSEHGLFYLVVLAENKPKEIEKKMSELGFAMIVVNERKIRGEHLFVMRFSRKIPSCSELLDE